MYAYIKYKPYYSVDFDMVFASLSDSHQSIDARMCKRNAKLFTVIGECVCGGRNSIGSKAESEVAIANMYDIYHNIFFFLLLIIVSCRYAQL